MPNGSGDRTLGDVRELARQYRERYRTLEYPEARGPVVHLMQEFQRDAAKTVLRMDAGSVLRLIETLAEMPPIR